MCTDNISDRELISVGMKFGCLMVTDDGKEYLQILDAQISSIREEKAEFLKAIGEREYPRQDWHGWDGNAEVITPAYIYTPVNFSLPVGGSIRIQDFDKAIKDRIKEKDTVHYRCECRLCGKIRYYSADTILTKPKYCKRPMYCSSKQLSSTKASNANYRKREKYGNDESVEFVSDKNDVIPSDEYCDSWNRKKENDLIRKSSKEAEIIAALPRVPAKNFDVDYVGLKYGSLEVLECVDEYLESVPTTYRNFRHQKKYNDIIVRKQYRCRCHLCEKEKLVTCDEFGIFPPTAYGPRATAGYWSKVYCKCHKPSSFEWIVNDILNKHHVEYQTEVSVDGLFGDNNVAPLRFDFAAYKDGQIIAFIECQGIQHYMPQEKYGGIPGFEKQQRFDEKKRQYARDKDIKLIEISYKDKKYDKIKDQLHDAMII